MLPFRVLFVCIGNVCRSPVGERLLAARLPADRFEISSAGVRALEGRGMSPHAAAELVSLGGDPAGFVARSLDEQMLVASDLNLTATVDLRSEVLTEFPGVLRRTFTVREFAALLDIVGGGDPLELVERAQARRSDARDVEMDIADPYLRGVEAHRVAAELMHTAVERIAKGLLG